MTLTRRSFEIYTILLFPPDTANDRAFGVVLVKTLIEKPGGSWTSSSGRDTTLQIYSDMMPMRIFMLIRVVLQCSIAIALGLVVNLCLGRRVRSRPFIPLSDFIFGAFP